MNSIIITGPSMKKPSFSPKPVRIVVDKVACRQVFLQASQYLPVSIIPPMVKIQYFIMKLSNWQHR